MEIIKELVRSAEPTSTALGYFDGVHIGHRAVIGEAVSFAKHNGMIPAVFTLQQSPRLVLFGEAPKNIVPLEDKLREFEALGVERVYLIDFRTIRSMSAEDFVRDVLIGCFNAQHAGCGFNYHFGSGARGTGEMLDLLCRQYGVSETTQPRLQYQGSPISSTRIRRSVAEGDMAAVRDMLGRPYGFSLPVIHGRRLGRSLGFPTMNQRFPEGLVIPRFGAYAAEAEIDGVKWTALTNIGMKPTVGSEEVLLETWMPEYRGRDVYGENVRISLGRFIRPEKHFDSLEELKAAVEKDYRDMSEQG